MLFWQSQKCSSRGLFRTFWGNVADSSTAHVPDPITGTIVSVINGQTRLIMNGPGLFSRHFCLIEHPKLYMHIIWAFHDILSALTTGIYKPTLWTITMAASRILTVPIIDCSHRPLAEVQICISPSSLCSRAALLLITAPASHYSGHRHPALHTTLPRDLEFLIWWFRMHPIWSRRDEFSFCHVGLTSL